ncbi:hypothetical protein ACP70R_020072 [Stipagrostis hirtigluma subsp. patula]
MKIFFAICLLLVSGAPEVQSRRHSGHPQQRHYRPLFVFGDSFVDAGNVDPVPKRSVITRGWYYPYGSSDTANNNDATGRLSDGLVQSDLVAKILGRDKSPRPYRLQKELDETDRSGVNFAMAGAGVYEVSPEVPTLAEQIGQFRRLLEDGAIHDEDLTRSVALVSISDSRDYSRVTDSSSSDDVIAFVENLTDEIVDSVKQLQKLGVAKVLVNSLPPIGCAPWRSFSNNYSRCDSRVNTFASLHNALLKQKLGGSQDVLVLDLYTMFDNVVEPNSGSTVSKEFKHKYTPCCDSPNSDDGYCGQEDNMGRAQYHLCDKPDKYFYWDYEHPTQAGWKAVMQQLEVSINDFLGISS